MKYSSARQLAFDYEAPAAVRAAPSSIGLETTLEIPQYDPVTAATSRIAGRINAANVPEHEHKALLREREREFA